MEIVYIPVEEKMMIGELTLPDGDGPFEALIWIGNPVQDVVFPQDKAVLIILEVVDHPLWFAALCDEIRMQDFYTKRAVLRVDVPIVKFKTVARHPFYEIIGEFAQDVKRCFPGNDYS